MKMEAPAEFKNWLPLFNYLQLLLYTVSEILIKEDRKIRHVLIPIKKTFMLTKHSSSQQRLDQPFYVLTLNFEMPLVAYF